MTKAFLEITLNIAQENRNNAGAVYTKYKQPFLSDVPGAITVYLTSTNGSLALPMAFPECHWNENSWNLAMPPVWSPLRPAHPFRHMSIRWVRKFLCLKVYSLMRMAIILLVRQYRDFFTKIHI